MSRPEHRIDAPQPALPWLAERHEAYLGSRDATSRYNPAAEYGDHDWREPASDAEAAARTAYLREHFPPAPGWTTHRLTPVEDALEDAAERAVLADRAHDPDPHASAEYQRLQALDRLAPLPAHDVLNDLPRDEHGRPDTLVAPDWHDGDQVVSDHWAVEAAFDGREASASLALPDAPQDLRQRLENLRASRTAEAVESLPDEDNQRREQLLRWHDDDHRTPTDADLDSGQYDSRQDDSGHGTDSGYRAADSAGERGWGR